MTPSAPRSRPRVTRTAWMTLSRGWPACAVVFAGRDRPRRLPLGLRAVELCRQRPPRPLRSRHLQHRRGGDRRSIPLPPRVGRALEHTAREPLSRAGRPDQRPQGVDDRLRSRRRRGDEGLEGVPGPCHSRSSFSLLRDQGQLLWLSKSCPSGGEEQDQTVHEIPGLFMVCCEGGGDERDFRTSDTRCGPLRAARDDRVGVGDRVLRGVRQPQHHQ